MFEDLMGRRVRVELREGHLAICGTLLDCWVTSHGDTLALDVDGKVIPWRMVAWVEAA